MRNWTIKNGCICESNGRAILDIEAIGGETEEDVRSNVALIAAAPKILAALEQLLFLHPDSYIHKGSDRHPTKLPPLAAVANARAVIAEATGK